MGPSVFLENQAVERFEKDLHSTGGSARWAAFGAALLGSVRVRVCVCS